MKRRQLLQLASLVVFGGGFAGCAGDPADADPAATAAFDPAEYSLRITVFGEQQLSGEVRNPGQYPYVSGMTALSAVAMAGGFTCRAREDYVEVTRSADPGKKPRRAPVTAPILPDDVIRVPERYF